MDMGAPELARAMIGIGRRLGVSKVRCAAAMAKGGAAMKKYNHACEQRAVYLAELDQDHSWNARSKLAAAIDRSEENRPIPCIHGDPACIFNPQVNGHLLKDIEQDFRISWLPLSEHLLFLWQEHGVDITARRQQLEELRTVLGRFRSMAKGRSAKNSRHFCTFYGNRWLISHRKRSKKRYVYKSR